MRSPQKTGQQTTTPSTETVRTRPAQAASARRNGGVESIMLRLSRERANQLARDLLDAMTRNDSVALLKDREVVRQAIAHALADEFKREEEREENVRRRIASIKRGPEVGSRDYEQMFRKLMEEEYLREGLDT